MSTEIVKRESGIIRSYDDAERAAAAMAASGYFQDAHQAAQAIVKVLAGQELGFGPFVSMTGIYIIQGRPAISANLMAAAVKRSGRYNFRVIELTDTNCEIAFYEGGQEIGRSVFTADDAKRAGTQNMGKFPRNMLFARAMSNGVRWYCPDVLGGQAVYTPDELGAVVDADGEVTAPLPAIIHPTCVDDPAPTLAPTPAPAPAPHWSEVPKTRSAFWARANERGLTQQDVHAALGVEHLRDFPGTLADAGARITAYIQERTQVVTP